LAITLNNSPNIKVGAFVHSFSPLPIFEFSLIIFAIFLLLANTPASLKINSVSKSPGVTLRG